MRSRGHMIKSCLIEELRSIIHYYTVLPNFELVHATIQASSTVSRLTYIVSYSKQNKNSFGAANVTLFSM